MSIKVIALGNILMKDDAIGIEIAKKLENTLIDNGIEVIYGETNLGYCISKVAQEDFLWILDATCTLEKPGDMAVIPIEHFVSNTKNYTQHSFSFLDVLKLYYPNINGQIIAIQVYDIDFSMGLSPILTEKLNDISSTILSLIENLKRG